MTDFIIDLTSYKDRVGARVDPGRYRVRVEDAEMDKSKAGNPMVNLWLTIQGGEFDGLTLTDRLTITEKALFRVVGFMQAIGLPTPKKRLKMNTDRFVGKVLDVDVEDGEPYLGRIKSEVRGYIKVTKGSLTAAAEETDLDDLEEEGTYEEPAAATAPEEPEEAAPEPASEPAPKGKKKKPAPAPEPEDDDDDVEVIDLESLDL